MLHTEAQITIVVDVPLTPQAVVLNIGVGVLATVFTAQGVDIQLQAEVVGQVTTGAQIGVPQLAPARVECSPLLQSGLPLTRNRLADEVDDPANVVRAVLHRCAPAHDINTIDRGHGHWKQRQARLAVRCQCQRDAIGQSLDPAAAALIEPAYRNLRQGAGAGFVKNLDPGDPLQSVVQTADAGFFQIAGIDDTTTTGVSTHVLIAGCAENVPLNRHGCQFQTADGGLLSSQGGMANAQCDETE